MPLVELTRCHGAGLWNARVQVSHSSQPATRKAAPPTACSRRMPAGLDGKTVPAAVESASSPRAARSQPPGGAQRCSVIRMAPRGDRRREARARRGAGRGRTRVATGTEGSLKLAQVFGVRTLCKCDGGPGLDHTLRALELLATQVAPALGWRPRGD